MANRIISSACCLGMLLGTPFFANAQFSEVHENWQVSDIGAGIKPSFDFGPNDEIHVMGMTEALVGVAWHASANSLDGPWEPTPLSDGYFYGPGDLRVDDRGTAHIAFHDHDIEDAIHFAVGPNGTQRTVMVTPGTHDGWDNSLAVTSSGELRMASIFPAPFGAVASLVVGSLESSEWEAEALAASGRGMYGLNTSIDVDSSDRTHVAYNLAGDWTGPGAVRYATQNESGTWNIENIELGINVGRFPSLAVDNADRVHIAWINLDLANPQTADVRYGQRIDDHWQIETVAQMHDVQMGFSGARKSVSLEVDSLGNAHLAFGDRNQVSYATRTDDGTWEESRIITTDTNILNGLVVLRLDSNDTPGIAFWRPVDGPGQGIVSLAMANSLESLLGDFDADGLLTSFDIDFLAGAFGSAQIEFDLTNDSIVDQADQAFWLTEIANVVPGDANFDGTVDFGDFLVMSRNFNTQGGWAQGNFNGVNGVEFGDFLILSNNFGTRTAASVPEPPCFPLTILLPISLLPFRARTSP